MTIDNIKFSISSIMLGIKNFLLSMMWMWAFIRLNRKELTKEGEKKFIYTKEEDTSKTWKLLTKRDSLIITCILHGTAPHPPQSYTSSWLFIQESVSERLNHNSSILDCSLIPMELKNKTHKFRALSPIYKALLCYFFELTSGAIQ